MKKLLLTSFILSAALTTNVSASLKSAKSFKFIGDTEYAELCQAAATNDLDLFKKNVKHHGYRLSASKNKMLMLMTSGNNFECAGQSLVEFSQSRGAKDIANYLAGNAVKNETASTKKYKFVGDKNFKNFCKSALTDNVNLFRRAVSGQIGQIGVSKKQVMNKVLEAQNVTCGGQGLNAFFEQQQATKVMGYIAESISK